MNSEQKFYKGHPLVAGAAVGMIVTVVGGLVLLLITNPIASPRVSIGQVFYGNSSQTITQYTVSNSSLFPATGDITVTPRDGQIESITIIKGQGRVVRLPNGKWGIEFSAAKSQDLQLNIASGAMVAVDLRLDSSTFFGRIKKLIGQRDSFQGTERGRP